MPLIGGLSTVLCMYICIISHGASAHGSLVVISFNPNPPAAVLILGNKRVKKAKRRRSERASERARGHCHHPCLDDSSRRWDLFVFSPAGGVSPIRDAPGDAYLSHSSPANSFLLPATPPGFGNGAEIQSRSAWEVIRCKNWPSKGRAHAHATRALPCHSSH